MPASSVSEPCVGHPRHGFNTGYLVLTVFSRRAVPYIYMLSSQLVLTADTDLALHVIGSVLVMQIIKIANLPITAIYTIHAGLYIFTSGSVQVSQHHQIEHSKELVINEAGKT